MSDRREHISHFYLKFSGQNAPEDLYRDLLEVAVESSLHLPDVATIILHDPKLKWVDHASIALGKELVVSASSGETQATEQKIFDGEIVEIEPEFEGASMKLVIRAFDRLHRLARGRQVRSFVNVNDGDLVKKLAQEVGLQFQCGPTPTVMPHILQANQTNLEFLQERAAANGYLLYVEGSTLHFKKAESTSGPIELQWGASLSEFRPRMSTIGQVNEVTVRGWDPAKKQEVIGQANDTSSSIKPAVGFGKSGGQAAKSAFNITASYLISNQPLHTQEQARRVAQAYADRLGGRFIEADGLCQADPKIVAGSKVKITAIGERFSGTYFVTGATHLYNQAEGYVTRFQVSGLQPSNLLSVLLPTEESSSTRGLMIGIVTDNVDPDKLGRVKVKFPTMTNDHSSFWLRVVSSGGGEQRGMQYLPEVNDEVLVGFEHGDPNHGYVLGGLWNGKDTPPIASDQAVKSGKVVARTLRSRTGHEITMHEEAGQKEEILIKTAGGLIIRLSDKDKLIELKSQNSSVTLDDQGRVVTIDTSGDLKIKSQGKVSIEGQAGLEMKTPASLALEGQGSVDVKSSGTLGLEGGASTELKSSGILTLQGSLVKIN